ncbi:hypothetical protein [Streptomyces sp. NPDC002845]
MQHADKAGTETGAIPRTEQAPGGVEQLEQRVRSLEKQMDTLVQAVRALTEGLERSPGNGAGDGDSSARGARLAHEILLSQGL